MNNSNGLTYFLPYSKYVNYESSFGCALLECFEGIRFGSPLKELCAAFKVFKSALFPLFLFTAYSVLRFMRALGNLTMPMRVVGVAVTAAYACARDHKQDMSCTRCHSSSTNEQDGYLGFWGSGLAPHLALQRHKIC